MYYVMFVFLLKFHTCKQAGYILETTYLYETTVLSVKSLHTCF
jgi:hypothetical protein